MTLSHQPRPCHGASWSLAIATGHLRRLCPPRTRARRQFRYVLVALLRNPEQVRIFVTNLCCGSAPWKSGMYYVLTGFRTEFGVIGLVWIAAAAQSRRVSREDVKFGNCPSIQPPWPIATGETWHWRCSLPRVGKTPAVPNPTPSCPAFGLVWGGGEMLRIDVAKQKSPLSPG